MANEEHLKIIKKGVYSWNDWRKKNPDTKPDLGGANLSNRILVEVNLSWTDLRNADFSNTNLRSADLTGANLTGAGFDLAKLQGAELSYATLYGADFRRAEGLEWTGRPFSQGGFTGARFNNATKWPRGFDPKLYGGAVKFDLFGGFHEAFASGLLEGRSVEKRKTEAGPTRTTKEIFVSYSRKDLKTVDRLVIKLESTGHQVWIDRKDIKTGQWKEQIVKAIETCDVFIIVLSPNAAESDNVRKELDVADNLKKAILPVVIREVPIPTSMRLQLAGVQRIDLIISFDKGVKKLLKALKK